ncbi:MAG: protein kinase [Verrucomicrobia bacterium]|nr:protein kinase [Verrucomicrobiota bacterium]
MSLPLALEYRSRVEEFQHRHRVGLVTLLFTDMVGSTQLKQDLGDHSAVALIQQHHTLVREALQSFKEAAEISTAGDSFFLVFTKPSDAVKFALLLQAGLRSAGGENSSRVSDRIGIHVGEVFIEQEAGSDKTKDLYGIQVDTCARVMALASANQILMTRFAFDNARQVLRGTDVESLNDLKTLNWLNHGPYLLKGLAEPIEICEVRVGTDGPTTPPTSSEKAQRYVSADAEPVLGWRPAVDQKVPGTEWSLVEKLGEGGFGEVWLGRHDTLKQLRVFKFCFRADRVRALKREVTLFRLLQERVGEHPNIMRLLEVFFDEPPFYLEMEYVEGKDLKSWCEAQGGVEKIPLATRLEIVAQAADALQAAHDAGVIHRDVKPGNILAQNSSRRKEALTFSPGTGAGKNEPPNVGCYEVQVKLTDFGIGQVVSEEYLAGRTRAGFTQTLLGSTSSHTGTQMYMAPELLAGKPASTRSDIYSLGIVLYQLLVGDFARPLTTDWTDHVSDPLLRDDLKHCFAGNPQDRFAGAAQLAKNLRALPQRRAEFARQQAELVSREKAAYRRGMMRTAAVAAVIVVLIAGLALVARNQSKRAARNAESLRRHLYCSDMAVAWNAWQDGDVQRTRDLLTNQFRALGQGDDLRGFEWRYLWGRSRAQELFVLPTGGFSVKFSPDGRTVAATSGGDGVVQLWDFASHKLNKSIKAYTNMIWSVAFSPNGKLLATTSRADSDFKVWDATTGNLLATLSGTNQENVNAIFSPDGKRLATIACKPYKPIPAEVKVWDLASQRVLMSLPSLKSWAWTADFSPDGKTLAISDGEGLIRLWNLTTGSVRLLTGHTGYATGVKFSHDGRILATGDQNGTILLWNWGAGTVFRVLTGHQGPINGLVFSSNGKSLASASRDHTAMLWDPKTGDLLARFLGHKERVWGLDISPDGRTLATIGGDGIRFWSTSPSREGEILTHPDDEICRLRYSPDGRLLVVDEGGTNGVTLWESASKRIAGKLPGRDLTFSPGGKILTLIQGETNVVVYETATMRLVGTITSTAELGGGTAISPEGKWLALRRGGKPVIMDLGKMREIAALESGSGNNMFFSSDSKTLITEEGGGIRLWDTVNWRPIGWLCSTNNHIGPIALSGDGSLLAAASGETVRLWNLKTRTAADNPVLGHTASGIFSLAFSQDGKNVAAGTFDGVINLWNVPGRQEIGSFKLHRSVVWGLAFSPDNHTLISQSYDHTVRLWTAPAYEEAKANF